MKIANREDVIQVVEDSVKHLRAALDADQKQYGERLGASLIVGFYAVGKPHLCTCEIFGTAVLTQAEHHYTAAGVGATLANYLLGEYSIPRETAELGLATLIYVVQKVKENNAYCGGDTTLKILLPVSVARDYSPCIAKFTTFDLEFVTQMEKELSRMDQRTKKARTREVISILKRVGSRLSAKRMKQVKIEEEQERRLHEQCGGIEAHPHEGDRR